MSGISVGSYTVEQGVWPPPLAFVIHSEQGRLAGGEANITETVISCRSCSVLLSSCPSNVLFILDGHPGHVSSL